MEPAMLSNKDFNHNDLVKRILLSIEQSIYKCFND